MSVSGSGDGIEVYGRRVILFFIGDSDPDDYGEEIQETTICRLEIGEDEGEIQTISRRSRMQGGS